MTLFSEKYEEQTVNILTLLRSTHPKKLSGGVDDHFCCITNNHLLCCIFYTYTQKHIKFLLSFFKIHDILGSQEGFL